MSSQNSSKRDPAADPVRDEPNDATAGTSPDGAENLAADVAGATRNTHLQLQGLSDELQSANERALRAQAELENFRKRMRREIDEERRYFALPLVTELVPLLDNLDLAINSGEKNAGAVEIVQGIKMVYSQFMNVLERNHCRRLGAVGEAFDPNQHQAIAQEPSDQYPAGTVTRVARHGYQLHDRVVRPAEVLVSVGPAGGSRGN